MKTSWDVKNLRRSLTVRPLYEELRWVVEKVWFTPDSSSNCHMVAAVA